MIRLKRLVWGFLSSLNVNFYEKKKRKKKTQQKTHMNNNKKPSGIINILADHNTKYKTVKVTLATN